MTAGSDSKRAGAGRVREQRVRPGGREGGLGRPSRRQNPILDLWLGSLQGGADVHGRQNREDVRLEQADRHVERPAGTLERNDDL
jgi:hypothetical protein